MKATEVGGLVVVLFGLLGPFGCEADANGSTKKVGPSAPIELSWIQVGKDLGARRIFDQTLAQAQKDKRPVLVDFRADWCAACNELDKHVFSVPGVKAELARFVLIRVDATEETGDLLTIMKRYSVLSLPTLLMFDAAGTPLKKPRVEEYIEADELLKRLSMVRGP